MPLLEVDHLSCSLRAGRTMAVWGRARTVLRDVTFSIEKGHVFGLLGPSGSGKSTIARCLTGLAEPDGGSIRFDGETVFPAKRPRRPDPRMQMLFQASGSSLDPSMTIRESIEEGFFPLKSKITKEEKNRRLERLVADVGLHVGILERRPHQVSGGQRQRIALVRSLAAEPLLLILDEPTAALDPITRSNVFSLLRSLQQTLGLTLLYITHDRASAHSFCDGIGFVKDGVICPPFSFVCPTRSVP